MLMNALAQLFLVVAMVAGADIKELPTCDQTSLLQVGSALTTNRALTAGGDDPEEKKNAKNMQEAAAAADKGVAALKNDPAAALTEAAPVSDKDPAAALVGKVFKLFGKGSLKGQACKAAMADLWTTDAAIDFRGPQDKEYFKKYDSGHDGICEYFANSYKVHLHDLKVAMYNKGDKLIDVWSYVPGLADKSSKQAKAKLLASERVTQYNMFTLNEDKTKLRNLEVLFDKPEVLDRLKFGKEEKPVKTNQMGVADKVLHAFTSKKLAGSSCQKQATELFAKDAEIDQTPYFQKFSGLDGVCEYFDKCYMAKMHNLTTNMYARGDDVVMVLKYVPGLANLDVRASSPITQYNVVRFDKDKVKVNDFTVFFDNPAVFTELTQEAMHRMMSGVMAATADKGAAALTLKGVMADGSKQEEASAQGKDHDDVAILDEGKTQKETEDLGQGSRAES